MIALRRLNGQELVVNADLIETIESTPDTLLSLTNGKKMIVQNGVEEVVRKAIRYKQLCHQAPQVVQRDAQGRPKEDGKQ